MVSGRRFVVVYFNATSKNSPEMAEEISGNFYNKDRE
jgi:hypothetical protein